MPFSTIYTCPLEDRPNYHYYKKLDFASKDEYQQWDHDIMVLKAGASSIFIYRLERKIPPKMGDDMTRQWLHECSLFVNKWGTDNTPADIRMLIHAAEENCGIPHTNFGSDLCLMYYRDPNVTDLRGEICCVAQTFRFNYGSAFRLFGLLPPNP